MFVIDENPVPAHCPSPPGYELTHTLTHMRKGAERAGCGRRPPGGKSGGIRADFARTGQECDGRLWQGAVWFVRWEGLQRGAFPALAIGGSLLSALGLSLSMRCKFSP